MSSESVLSIENLTKRYGATTALSSVSLEAERGEVHAILGENGAGKSTLVKILSGAVSRNSGTIRLAGAEYNARSILEARAAGVATAFQELSLLPNLTIAQNLLLPRVSPRPLLPAGRRRILAEATAILERFEAQDIDPRRNVGELSLAEK